MSPVSRQPKAPVLTAQVSATVTRTAELRTLDDLARAIEDLHERVEKEGRDPTGIAVQIGGTLSVGDGIARPDEQLEQIAALARMGVTDVLVGAPDHRDLGKARDTIADYGEKVVSAC